MNARNEALATTKKDETPPSQDSAATKVVYEGQDATLNNDYRISKASDLNFAGFYGLIHDYRKGPTHMHKPSDSVEYCHGEDSKDISFDKLQGNNHVRQIRASRSDFGTSSKFSKESLKMVIQMMIEDIWSNFDNYSLQHKVVM